MMKRTPTQLFLFIAILCEIFSPLAANAITLPNGMTIEKTLSIGESVSGTIPILNPEKEPKTVRIYQTDYLFYADGRNEFGKPGSTPRSNATWVSYSPNQVVVPANGSAEVSYRISVPNDPNLKGTYWSVLMIEPLPEGALTPPPSQKGKVVLSMQTVVRHAVQIITNIGDTGTRALQFVSKTLVSKEGKTFFLLDIKNTGERWLIPEVDVDLYGPNGPMGRYTGGKLRIFPGCSVRYTVDLGSLKPGKYQALVIADAGEEKVFGARYLLEVR